MKRLLPLFLTMVLVLCALTGTALADNKFYFDRSVSTVFEGESLQLVLVREGDCADAGTLTFTSSNQRAATVDEYGVVTGVGKGSTTITATLRGASRTWKATLTVTVARPVTEITVTETKMTVVEPYDPLVADVLDPNSPYWDLPVLVLSAGKSVSITAKCGPSDATNRQWVLTTSDESIVRASGTSFTARAAGECMVTVQSKQNPEVYKAYRALVVQPVTKVTVSGSVKTFYVGEEIMLEANVSPANATIQGVVWSSSNESNATVDQFGVVTGVSKGDATITAKAADGSGRYGTFVVTVKQQPEEITLSRTDFDLKVGNYMTLKATVLPEIANDKAVVWSTSDASVAKVNSSGRVTAVSPGTAVITCESKNFPGVYAQALVTVYQPVTKVAFVQRNATVPVGGTIVLGWEVSPDTATDPSVTLSTNKESILSVSQDGTVVGLARGEAYVYATANDGSGKKATIKVTVTQPVEGVGMRYDEVSVGVGSKVTNTAEFQPSDASITNMTWTSVNPQIATVSGTGKKATVTGRAWGQTTIVGVTEDGGYVTSFDVTVGNYDEALQIVNLYAENDYVRIVVQNQSNMTISRFYYEIELYDAWGNPLDCNYRNHTNRFEGSYGYTLTPGEATRHGRFSFGSEFSRPWGIGKVVMRITAYETADGYNRYIREEDRPEFIWEVTVIEPNNY